MHHIAAIEDILKYAQVVEWGISPNIVMNSKVLGVTLLKYSLKSYIADSTANAKIRIQ